MAQKYSRISVEINPPYVLDLDFMATTLMEEARSLVMAPTMPWLARLGGLRPLNPRKIVTTRWSVFSTKRLATIIHSPHHSMKPSNPYSNLREGEPYYAGNHSGTEQVPGPTMSFSPRLSEADPNQDVSEWRFDTCWVSHAEKDDEIHLNYGNDDYGGGSVSVHGSNHAIAGGPWGTPDPQPLQNSDYSMVSIFHQISSDNHPLILLFHEAKYSIQQQP
jgi:hypothetical protein